MALQLPQQRPAIRLEHLSCEQRPHTQHTLYCKHLTNGLASGLPWAEMPLSKQSHEMQAFALDITGQGVVNFRRVDDYLHNAILAAGHQQLAILPKAAAVGPVFEAGICPADLPRVAIVYDDLRQQIALG